MPAEVKSCKAIANDKDRLKCFDRLFGETFKPPNPSEAAQANWAIEGTKSPDGNGQVVAANLVGDVVLILRCKNQITEAAFSTQYNYLFAAVRVRTADGPPQRIWDKGQQHLPGDEAWLIGEHRASGEKKYYLANLAAGMDLRSLAATIKARWICEQAHQQLKEELGLDHFEGRSWHGLHRHALMAMIAYAFLQHRRLKKVRRGKRINGPPPQPTLPAVRHAIVDLIMRSSPQRCPYCRSWISEEKQRE